MIISNVGYCCSVLNLAFVFIFAVGFDGQQCEIDLVNGCLNSPCDGSAMCQDTTDGFRCLCPVDSIVQDEL